MILEKNIKLKIGSNKQACYFNRKGFMCKIGDIIDIDVSQLTNGSHVIIKTKCDICDKEKNMKYGKYYELTYGCVEKYYCNKCSYIKSKETKLNRYGNENYNNSEKYKETCLKLYNVENCSKTEICKEKVKKTKLIRYNDENFNNKTKSILTSLEKYGCNHHFQNDDIKQKIKNTLIIKYGVDSYSKTESFKNKVFQTNINKYGVGNYSNIKK